MEISYDFKFLSGHSLNNMNSYDLQKASADVGLKFNEDINAAEKIEKTFKTFKHAALSVFEFIINYSWLYA